MRLEILSSLVLVPVLAHAQTVRSTETKGTSVPMMLEAELNKPAGLAEVAGAAGSASKEKPAGLVSTSNAAPKALQTVQEQATDDTLEAMLRMGGTLEYSMKGSNVAPPTAARMTKAVELQLTPEELAAEPAVSSVVVRAIVDENGIPRNVAVSKSAGAVVDQKAVAAVTQYRFKPATIDNQPTWSSVSIAIKISKPQQ